MGGGVRRNTNLPEPGGWVRERGQQIGPERMDRGTELLEEYMKNKNFVSLSITSFFGNI